MTNSMEQEYIPMNFHRPTFIAGPCAAETEEQVLKTARQLADKGFKIFRAGIWKPRTKPGCFEGIGKNALPWLTKVKEYTGMLVATEVATPEHVELAMRFGIDILWVGARTTTNPFAVQTLAEVLHGVKTPIFIKNPVNPDVELWAGAIERFARENVLCLGVIHRGFSSYDKTIYRNAPMWQLPIELHHRYPELPIFCDPSHMGGMRELVAPLSQQALDLGYDGLFVESHCSPNEAWSDSCQQITPQELANICLELKVRDNSEPTKDLDVLRQQIDELDNRLIKLLGERIEMCRVVGRYKKSRNMPVLQTGRYDEILRKRKRQAPNFGLGTEFVGRIFKEIHEESVKQQLKAIT